MNCNKFVYSDLVDPSFVKLEDNSKSYIEIMNEGTKLGRMIGSLTE